MDNEICALKGQYKNGNNNMGTNENKMNTDMMKPMLPFQGAGIAMRLQTQGVGWGLSKTVAIGLGYFGLPARKPIRRRPAFDCFAPFGCFALRATLRQRRAL